MIKGKKHLKKFLNIFLMFLFFMSFLSAKEFYWESPSVISGRNGQFLQSASNGNISASVWEEVVKSSDDAGLIYISAGVYANKKWIINERIIPPISYTADIPSIASITVGNDDSILIALVKNRNTITILKSTDYGKTYTVKNITTEIYDLLSPQLSVASNGNYLMFVSHGADEKFSVFFSSSKNGLDWPDFKEFDFIKKTDRVFFPAHTAAEKNDVLIFQALDKNENISSYQLFSSFSSDGGSSWSEPIRITDDFNFNNQRPNLLYIRSEKSIFLVWEQSPYRREKSSTAYAVLDNKGMLTSPIEVLPSGDGTIFSPKVIAYNNKPLIAWSEDYNGKASVLIARKDDSNWVIDSVESITGSLLFVNPFFVDGNLHILWQEGIRSAKIMHVEPDYEVGKAQLQPLDFDSKTLDGKQKITMKIKFPNDSSGVAGYSYEWTKDAPPEFVEPVIKKLPNESVLVYEPEEDGLWYLGVRVCDYAGNWSEMSTISYERDIVPPSAPIFDLLALDKSGFLKSNTFDIQWNPPEFDIEGKPETAINGYIWNLSYLGTVDKFLLYIKNANPSFIDDTAVQEILSDNLNAELSTSKINSTLNKREFKNYENGLYALTVSAVDAFGNIGVPAVKYFALNKYIPYTYVADINTEQNLDGSISLSIVGKGFSAGGAVTALYIDADGSPPYDLTIDKKDFSILSDKLISNIKIDYLDPGKYYVGLMHSGRGIYFAGKTITFNDIGNIKLGNYKDSYKYNWLLSAMNSDFTDYFFIIFLTVFILLVMIFSITGVIYSIKETIKIKNEVTVLLSGGAMIFGKEKKISELKVRGMGLRLKFILFTTTLVISVILTLALPLGSRFSETQERLLAEGLASNTQVLLESLTSGAKAYLPSKNVLELGFLPSQTSALKEANFATITGVHIDNKKVSYNFVWASNDSDIISKIDSSEFIIGESELSLPDLEPVYQNLDKIDEEARENVGELAEEIQSLTNTAMEIALSTDSKSIERRNEIQSAINQMEEKLNSELSRLSAKGSGSYPEFNSKKLSRDVTNYLFYKPILYRQAGDQSSFIHGMVYVQVSTKGLIEQIDEATSTLYKIILLISLSALAAGIAGAYILSSIITAPIKKLVEHVAMISATEDKELLAGKDVKLKTKDEIGVLGTTINAMTNGLVEAAAASKDLTMGKEIQKMFLPLDLDEAGRKLTSGKSVDDNVEFFGYYEGARGVSGDYFDYIKLDDRYYAIIKCDVAGKGVPAALIMVEVATLFLDYFRDWSYKKQGLKIDQVVSRINDLLESRGFKGRFAAFTLCIMDSISGNVHFCNAGDNVINIYDAALKKMKEVILTEVSAAGVFPTFMIDMKGGFKVETVKLNPGDVLFLYTDGIEEAKRLFRNSKLEPILCEEPGLEKDAEHETHSVGQDGEELGKPRVCKIIESIFARSSFSLKKWHNPIENEQFDFDFTNLEGTIEDAVIGLVSVEKIFRMYQDPKATERDMVQVDKKIDLFLNKHFRQYQTYCGHRVPNTSYNEYLYYTNVREDQQYDDLTILGVKKK
ncbi:SpoIIE family protein phosphatase [Treponema putidum]|uniref:SpoIIE family protein phosphatase n=1 Tax=Treponema putidum TaxID=221027 RepID=UPI002106C767|nr:SpoIIE family protein phosphatase [Treponema putidum]